MSYYTEMRVISRESRPEINASVSCNSIDKNYGVRAATTAGVAALGLMIGMSGVPDKAQAGTYGIPHAVTDPRGSADLSLRPAVYRPGADGGVRVVEVAGTLNPANLISLDRLDDVTPEQLFRLNNLPNNDYLAGIMSPVTKKLMVQCFQAGIKTLSFKWAMNASDLTPAQKEEIKNLKEPEKTRRIASMKSEALHAYLDPLQAALVDALYRVLTIPEAKRLFAADPEGYSTGTNQTMIWKQGLVNYRMESALAIPVLHEAFGEDTITILRDNAMGAQKLADATSDKIKGEIRAAKAQIAENRAQIAASDARIAASDARMKTLDRQMQVADMILKSLK